MEVSHVSALHAKHAGLEARIRDETQRPSPDTLLVAALTHGDLTRPRVTPGNDLSKPGEYDYWDHLDWVFDRAAAHGLYIALVPVWGVTITTGLCAQ